MLALKQRYRTLRALAEASGTDPSYLSQINIGAREMGDAVARQLEERLQLARGWMDVPHEMEFKVHFGRTSARSAARVRSHGSDSINGTQVIPIVEWSDLPIVNRRARRSPAAQYPPSGDALAVAAVSAFKLKVTGDSMQRPFGFPSFPIGCVITVDPAVRAEPDRFEVYKLPGDSEGILRQLVTDAGRHYLKPLNPQYPLIALPQKAIYCGRVMKIEMDL